jgi:type II secretory pathway component GspD/PulD (secretin)
MKLRLFASFLLASLVAVPARGQDTNIIRPTNGGFIVDFENQDIRAVISALSTAGGLNFTIAPNVQNNLRATLRLTVPITKEDIPEVLKGIVENAGLTFQEGAGGLFLIGRDTNQGRGRNTQQTTVNTADLQFAIIPVRHQSNVYLAQVLAAVFTVQTGRGGAINLQALQNRGNQNNQQRGGGAGGRGGAGGGRGGGRGGGGGGGGGGGDDDDQDPLTTALNRPALNPASSLTALYDPALIAEALEAEQGVGRRAEILGGLDQQGRGGGGGGGGIDVIQGGIAALLGNLGNQQQQGAAQQQTPVPVIVPMDGTNQLIVRGVQADIDLIRALVQAVDLRPLQVLIEVSIVEVRRSDDLNVGISGSGSYTKAGETDPRATGTLNRPTVFDNARDLFVELAGGRGTIDFNVAINALASRGDVSVRSVPVVFAQNNRQAQLIVGERRPFVSATQFTDNGTANSTVTYQDVATTLLITPIINADGYVNMDVSQSVQDVTSEIQFDAPVISTRQAITTLFVKSGQTAVIGGLASNRRDHTRSGIPFLSKIPIIGALFGATRNSDVVTELYLFLTPHVVQTDQEVDLLRELIRENSDLLKDVPLRQIIPRPDSITITIPPDTGTITRIPARVDTSSTRPRTDTNTTRPRTDTNTTRPRTDTNMLSALPSRRGTRALPATALRSYMELLHNVSIAER